jgi:hypothetical protein
MENLLGKKVEAIFRPSYLDAPVLLKGKAVSSNMTGTDYTLMLSDIPAEVREMLADNYIYVGSYVKVDEQDIKYVLQNYQGEEQRFIHNL